MISKKTLSCSLHYFSPLELSMGKYQITEILEINGNNKSVTAFYRNVSASIEFSGGQITNMRCDCGKVKYCRHLAGMVLVLLNNPDILHDIEAFDSGRREKQKKVQMRGSLLEWGKANHFRKIYRPLSFLQDVDDIGATHIEPFWGEEVEIFTDHPNFLYINMTDEDNHRNVTTVQFKRDKKNLYFRCSRCKEGSDELCSHQEWLLNYIETNWIRRFVKGELQFSSYYTTFEKDYPFSPKFLRKYFQIGFLEKDQIYLKPKGHAHFIDETSFAEYQKLLTDPVFLSTQKDRWLDQMLGEMVSVRAVYGLWIGMDQVMRCGQCQMKMDDVLK